MVQDREPDTAVEKVWKKKGEKGVFIAVGKGAVIAFFCRGYVPWGMFFQMHRGLDLLVTVFLALIKTL